jgi:hypothetical protein
MRLATLSTTVHDDVFDYTLPSDFRSIIDLYPQAERSVLDKGQRIQVEAFDRRKSIDDKKYSIEGKGGSKILRIDWNVASPTALHTMNSITVNGTWAAVAGATNVATDTTYKYSGSGSVKFDVAASGDGIDNTTMGQVDLTSEDEVADVFFYVYIKDAADLANFTSVVAIWGNDLTANYWTGVTQTAQADGTAFRVGWNLIKVPWSTATETGTVAPGTVDAFRVTFNVGAAITQLRVDNIVFAIGHVFDIRYYSKFLFQDSSGTWKSQPDTSSDVVILDNDAYNIFLYECLGELAHQLEGEDSAFDLRRAGAMLYGDPQALDVSGRTGLYAKYRSEHPAQNVKATSHYGMKPRYNNSMTRY